MKKLLIVVDYQIDFVSGSLGFDGAEKLDLPICNKIQTYRNNGNEVCYTFDTHSDTYLTTAEGRSLPVPHCIFGTEGHKLYGRTASMPKDNEKCFYKPAFGSTELFDYLRSGKYDEVELVGLVSNICVLTNAILAKTALPEAHIMVDANLCASHDAAMHEKALDVMQGVMIDVINR